VSLDPDLACDQKHAFADLDGSWQEKKRERGMTRVGAIRARLAIFSGHAFNTLIRRHHDD
jgi:hypothetical protein